jgi:hypothetical protein
MSRDTSDEAAHVQAEIVRNMGAERRFQLACQMSEMVRELARARIRSQHPEMDDAQVRDRLTWELYGYRREAR